MTTTAPRTADPVLRSHAAWSRANLLGLGLALLLGLADMGGAFIPANPDDGTDGPPVGVLVLGFAIGLVTVGLAARAWLTGSRGNVRAVAGLRILSVVSGLPAFFVDIAAWIKVVSAVQVLVTLACLVLLLRPARRGPVLD
jgi:hypothetical protein